MRSKALLSILALSAVVAVAAVPAAWSAPKYKVLHAFADGNDGGGLYGSLLLDSHGNLYGTTNFGGPGGPYSGGTVFELTPNPDGTWATTVLHGFCAESGCADGGVSYAGLIFDEAGNLYGTTHLGGSSNYGTVFELMPLPGGGLD